MNSSPSQDQRPSRDDCATALRHLHAFLDEELPDSDADEIRAHLDLCEECLDRFDLDQTVKHLVKQHCGSKAPLDLRGKVMQRLSVQVGAVTTTTPAAPDGDDR